MTKRAANTESAVPQGIAQDQTASVAPPVAAETDEERQLRYMIDNLDGDESYIGQQFNFYMRNFLEHTKIDTRTAYMTCGGIEATLTIDTIGNEKVKFPAKKPASKAKENYYKREDFGKKKVDPSDWATLKRSFAHDAAETDFSERDATYRNLMRLADTLNLNEIERESLKILYVMGNNPSFFMVVDNIFGDDLKQTAVGFARMMNRPDDAAKVFNALHFSSRLATYGIIVAKDEEEEYGGETGRRVFGVPAIDMDLIGCLDRPDMKDDEIVALLLGKQRSSPLSLSDFEHLGDHLDHLKKLVQSSVAAGKKGINILLHGPAGSGKTELAAVLAKELGLKLYAVGEDDEDAAAIGSAKKGDTTGKKRMSHLSRSQALLREARDSILLFDEIEDLLIKSGDSKKAADTESKIGVNRMLEENPVVTIWTGNDPEKFHEAVRQRMSYSIYMDYPPTLVREKIWKRRLEMANCTLPDADVRDLSRRYAAPPRMISKAIETLSIMQGGVETVEESLRAASKISFGQSDALLIDDSIPAGFDLDYLNANVNLKETFNRLVQAGKNKKPFSLLVEGKQGMGGVDFLRMMAEEMGMNPAEYNVADLVAPHPMMSPEMKVKSAFASAVDGRQFVILRGLENMVSNPRSSSTSEWNEPIAHLFAKEAMTHRLPLAVTLEPGITLPVHLDIIFSDKITMQPITPEQGGGLYARLFGEDMPEQLRPALQGAVSEDFLRLKDIMGKFGRENFSHGRAADLLVRMRKMRSGEPAQRIGF